VDVHALEAEKQAPKTARAAFSPAHAHTAYAHGAIGAVTAPVCVADFALDQKTP
jgi:hypothetical protein